MGQRSGFVMQCLGLITEGLSVEERPEQISMSQ